MFTLAEMSAIDASQKLKARERMVFAAGVHWAIEQIEQWLNRTVH